MQASPAPAAPGRCVPKGAPRTGASTLVIAAMCLTLGACGGSLSSDAAPDAATASATAASGTSSGNSAPTATPLWPAAPVASSRPPAAGFGTLRVGASSADAGRGLDLHIRTATQQQTVRLTGPLAKRWAWLPFRAVTQLFGSPFAAALNGRAALVYLQDGRLWRLRPEGYGSETLRQVSALRDACHVDAVRPLDAAGNDAWIELTVVSADGFCSAQGGARTVWTRLEAPANAAEVVPPASIDELDWLEDELGSVRAIVQANPASATLDVLHPQRLEKIGTVTGTPPFREARPLARLQRSLASWWWIDGRLHKLTWSGGTPTLGAAAPIGPVLERHVTTKVVDNELFVQSGREWLSVAADGRVRTLARLGEHETVLGAELLADHLLLATYTVAPGTSSADLAWWAVASDGSRARRFGDEPEQSLGYLGSLDGEALFLRRWARTDSNSTAPVFERLEAHRPADGRVRVLENEIDGIVRTEAIPSDTASRPLAHLIYRVPLTKGLPGGKGEIRLRHSSDAPARTLMVAPADTHLDRWIEDMADSGTAYVNLSASGSPNAVDLYEVLMFIDPPLRRLTQYLAP